MQLPARSWRWISAAMIILAMLLSALIAIRRPILFLDESAYLFRGTQIVDAGQFPPITNSPGVSLIHAASYLLTRDNPLGMDISGRVSSFLGISLLFLLIFAAARALLGQTWAIVAMLLGLLYAPIYGLTFNASNLWYAVAIAATLLIVIRIDQATARQRGRLVVALSLVTAISILFRNDGFVTYAGLTVVAIAALMRDTRGWRLIARLGLLWLLPFAVIMGVSYLLALKTTGVREFLPSGRTYVAFEQGMGIVHRFELIRAGKNPWYEGAALTAARFGTREENNLSVIHAVLSHPVAWAERIKLNMRDIGLRWYEDHNSGFAAIALIMAVMGWMILLGKRYFLLITTLGAILLPAMIYTLLTFWRVGYMSMYAAAVILASTTVLAQLWKAELVLNRRSWLAGVTLSLVASLGVLWLAWRYTRGLANFWGVPPTNNVAIEGGIAALLAGALIFAALRSDLTRQPIRLILVASVVMIWAVGNFGSAWISLYRLAIGPNPASQALLEAERAYIADAFANYRDGAVCAADPTLAWYARQKVTVTPALLQLTASGDVTKMRELAVAKGCTYVLLQTRTAPALGDATDLVWSQLNIQLLRIHQTPAVR